MENDFSFKDLFIPFTFKKAYLFIILIGIVVYFNALFGNFVWDDIGFILLSPELHSFNPAALVGPNVYNSGGYYRMVPSFYIAAIYSTFGPTPFYFHLFQIIMHILNACLLFYFFKRFFKTTINFFLILLFLIHPIQVESVSFISSVQSNLFFLFGIIALLISNRDLTKWKNLSLMSVSLLLSMLTKETGFLFILITILNIVLFKKQKNLRYFPIFILILLAYFSIRFGLGKEGFEKNIYHPLGRLPLADRLINIPEMIFYYLKTLIFPARLAIDQLWIVKKVNFNQFFLPLIIDIFALALISFFGFFVYKNNNKKNFTPVKPFKVFLFFTLWLCLGMGMLLQIFPLDMTVADRWLYMPIVGLIGILGLAVDFFISRYKKYQTAAIVIAALVIVVLSVRTMVRNANYTDAFTLYAHDIEVEDNYDLENMLGGGYLAVSQYDKALPPLLKSYEMYPRDSTLFNIGSAYEHLNEYQKAKSSYEQLVYERNIPVRDHVKQSAYLSLTKLLLVNAPPEETKKICEEALKLYPDQATIWSYLAISNYNLGLHNEALAAAGKAKTLLPNQSTELLYDRILNKKPLDLR